jgi:hypothetical protein
VNQVPASESTSIPFADPQAPMTFDHDPLCKIGILPMAPEMKMAVNFPKQVTCRATYKDINQ